MFSEVHTGYLEANERTGMGLGWGRTEVYMTFWLTDWLHGAESFLRSRQSRSKLTSQHITEPVVHCRVHKSLPLVPILSEINPVYSNQSYLSLRSILILSTYLGLGLTSDLFTSGFPTNILHAFLFASIRATCPVHLILVDLITLITLSEQYGLYTALW
jgi:hypothetical protein